MADSDNAILENLVRQAVVESGQPVPADGNIGPFITAELVKAGIDTTGAVITDAAGLAPGQLVSVKTVDQVLALGLGKDHPDLRRVLTQLPISGLSGTMASRFGAPDTVGVAGIPRAKTGTLTGISALAGITTDADGRALSFVVVADQVPASSEGTLGARTTLDRFVAALTRCGCR
jgi:D-alanyl-D-alanine carboxypeptidase/D-alanyl-D-alanine-endopeptidase (penicillin-binding protein 4)